ncbi:MAG: hypothetical protein ACTHWZ_01750 [Peptoniphilaceae bacterium]
MARKVTIYDILVSCPGDCDEFLPIIKEVLDNFNKYIGQSNNTQLNMKHWSTDSYPESGDRPQSLLNEQFVDSCDSCIALLWTKFGTPTDKYGSGTEEEIARMIDSGKPVFLYIIDTPVSPSKLDSGQYEKVQDFKNKYSTNGLYKLITSKEDLEKSLTNNMTMYFLKKSISVSAEKDELLGINRLPDLNLETSVCTNSLEEKLQSFLKSQESKILDELNQTQNIYLPIVKDKVSSENKNSVNITLSPAFKDASKKLQQISKQFSDYIEVITPTIPNKVTEDIKEYLETKNLKFNDDLFYLGKLIKSKNTLLVNSLIGGGGSNISLNGTDEEKQKYKCLLSLYDKITTYNGVEKYLNQLLKLNKYHIFLVNKGENYDEDIDVKLILPKGSLVINEKFPTPNEDIVDVFSKIDLLEKLLIPPNAHNLLDYSREIKPYIPHMPLSFPYQGKSIDDYSRDYKNNIDDIFEYNFYSTLENDIVNIKFDYIKHNTNINFPSYIFTNIELTELKFEISSKHTPELIEGVIDLK